ncbi:MAG: hypothetical protein ACRD7E_07655, partial [Bryobacteraceae bacterium]
MSAGDAVPGRASVVRDHKQIIPWIIAVVSGVGIPVLAIWYANRPTEIQYSTSKTVLGTDETTVVPQFRVQVGDTILQRLYLHTIRIQHQSGPEIENAKIGIELIPSVKLVGNTVTEAPGEVYNFECAEFAVRPASTGTTC